MSLPPPSAPNPPASSWAGRNWKWLVPAIALVVVAFIAGIIAIVLGVMKSSDAYIGALTQLKSSPAASEALGEPIQEGFFVLGHIEVSGTSGWANLAIPVAGPKAAATLFVVAKKSDGQWRINQLFLRVDGQSRAIDLHPR
jgi:hypothetical protein